MIIVNRKIILFLSCCIFILCCNNVFAQTSINEPSQEAIIPYRLFKTSNIWTFIKLNTINGKMWQVQFDVENNNRGSVVLSSLDLAKGKKVINGRFTLYPTENMYTFILLDQIDGLTWQIQWSHEEGNRLVIPIDK